MNRTTRKILIIGTHGNYKAHVILQAGDLPVGDAWYPGSTKWLATENALKTVVKSYHNLVDMQIEGQEYIVRINLTESIMETVKDCQAKCRLESKPIEWLWRSGLNGIDGFGDDDHYRILNCAYLGYNAISRFLCIDNRFFMTKRLAIEWLDTVKQNAELDD